MAAILKQTVIYVFVLLVVATTGGVGLFYDGCACGEITEEQNITEFSDQQGCTDKCCGVEEKNETSCCEPESGSSEHTNSCPSSNSCCYTFYSYFKTDVVNLVDPVTSSIKYPTACLVIPYNEMIETEDKLHSDQSYSEPSPPPRYGKELVTFLHMLDSDPFLIA